MALRLAGIGSPEEKIGQLSQENVSSSAYTVSFRANVTGYSGIVTGDSGRSRKIGHLQSESAVTFGRNNRSRSNGISGQIGAEYAGNPISVIDPTGTDFLGAGGPISRALAAHYGAKQPCDPSFSVAGGGGFLYFGIGFHPSIFAAELLGVISYDSQVGGQHGGLVAGGIGKYTGGVEAMRSWNDWSETISPIAFANGANTIAPKQLGPITIGESNYGGILELENGELQIGGYLGGAGSSGRAAGVGGYLSVTATSSCSCQSH